MALAAPAGWVEAEAEVPGEEQQDLEWGSRRPESSLWHVQEEKHLSAGSYADTTLCSSLAAVLGVPLSGPS